MSIRDEQPVWSVTPMASARSAQATRWTDSSVSERWVNSVRGQWCWTSDGYRSWDGRVWAEQADAEALEAARDYAKREAATAAANGDADELKRAAGRLSDSHLKAALHLARGQMAADLTDFDADPDIAVVGNGVIDLTTSDLMPHDPDRLVTKSSPVDYVAGATHPDWDTALACLPSEVADYMQVRWGQALTGHMPDDDVMTVLRGGGENGKTTMIGAIKAVFGDYAVLVPDKVLLGDTRDHTTELMTLRGSRWAYVEELPEARHLNTQRLKKIDGSEAVVARHTHKDNVEFPATWALTVSTNYEVVVDEVDDGVWRRLMEIRFPYRYRKPHQDLDGPQDRRGDPSLRTRLKSGRAQREAVLAWLVEGARQWYANGMTMPEPPAQVVADTTAWQKTFDQVVAYADDHLIIDPESAILITDLLASFNEWLVDRGHQKWAAAKLRSRMEDGSWLKRSGARLTGQETRDPATLSRPAMGLGGWPLKPAPARGRYLVGARFRTREDDLAELTQVRLAPAHSDLVSRGLIFDDGDLPGQRPGHTSVTPTRETPASRPA